MAASSKKTEVLVGTFLFVGFGLLGAVILMFGKLGDFFHESYEIKVNFSEASGLVKGSTVRLRGAKIGSVGEKPALVDGNKIQVVLKIDEEHRLEKGSVFRVGTASLLGDKEILVIPPVEPAEGYLSAGAVVEGGGPDGFERLQNEAESIAAETREVVRQAKSALAEIQESVTEIRKVATQLTTTLEKVNGEILSPANLESVSGSLRNLESASASFAKLGDDLEPVAEDFGVLMGEVGETNQLVQKSVKRIDPALAMLPGVVESIERTSEVARRALEKVQEKKGALGALVSDEELKGDLKDFVRNLKEKGILRYTDEESEDDPRERFQGRRR